MDYLLTFSNITKNDVALVGGKGASLGEMINAGVPVPDGFVITTNTYKEFSSSEIPQDIQNQILSAFDALQTQRIAVRSSAIAEDSKDASWAGQLESYLNVDRNNLIEKIKECWKSIQTQQALSYANENNVNQEELVVAVVVQKMIESEASGVMFSVNPVNKNKDEIMIEAIYGLGELLVQGMVTPNNFVLDKNTLEIKESHIAEQKIMYAFVDGENKEIPVNEEKANQPILNEDQLKILGELGVKIENHYVYPQDIEWGLENGKFYILQSRPITTL